MARNSKIYPNSENDTNSEILVQVHDPIITLKLVWTINLVYPMVLIKEGSTINFIDEIGLIK